MAFSIYIEGSGSEWIHQAWPSSYSSLRVATRTRTRAHTHTHTFLFSSNASFGWGLFSKIPLTTSSPERYLSFWKQWPPSTRQREWGAQTRDKTSPGKGLERHMSLICQLHQWIPVSTFLARLSSSTLRACSRWAVACGYVMDSFVPCGWHTGLSVVLGPEAGLCHAVVGVASPDNDQLGCWGDRPTVITREIC